MVEKVAKIWMDGEIVAWDDAKVHVLTHSLHYGLGAFEGIRAYRRADGTTTVFRLREHIDRLLDSCKLCYIKPRYSTRRARHGAAVELLRVNKMDEAYIRPMVYVGEGAMGIYVPEQSDPRVHRRLPLGRVPRARSARERHPRRRSRRGPVITSA